MDRKTYIKEVYSKYWLNARDRIYGFSKYNEHLCTYICDHIPRGQKLLDVGIGTGYPFGDFFQKNGYDVYGIDISAELIRKCRATQELSFFEEYGRLGLVVLKS